MVLYEVKWVSLRVITQAHYELWMVDQARSACYANIGRDAVIIRYRVSFIGTGCKGNV